MVHRVRVGLGQEHGVLERRPVGMIRIRLEVEKIALRQIHGELAVKLSPQLRVLRVPQLVFDLGGGLQQVDVVRPGLQGSSH
ncbi:hypothetical protein D3C80_2065080 [compost metagenome]